MVGIRFGFVERLKVGSDVILQGVLIGLALTMIVGVLTFLAHRRLPYKKMLIFTGGLLLVVLAVMVGETAQEMQLAGWINTTTINVHFPDWMGVWFCIFPTSETLLAQIFAVIYVSGSYLTAQYLTKRKAIKQKLEV